ncbi:MAG: hypothetical protein HYU56_03335 [Candidatus Aenigmarchaeota archaeon]|nr:hypothetical protein [Candidatus Aenigmarchaeota archaeon]MBS3053799.1 hypothetical protein [Candidatus Aenigmarchaeota archaeon]
MKLPVCCKEEMKMKLESPRFIEAVCMKCQDSVFVKKLVELKPQLIDD